MALALAFRVEEGLSDVRASGGKANSDDDISKVFSRMAIFV
jgi:hypothetical protein